MTSVLADAAEVTGQQGDVTKGGVDGRSAHGTEPGRRPAVSPGDQFLMAMPELFPGLLDIIDGYPSRGVAFIGLLAVKESLQGSGVGRLIYAEAERYLRDRLGVRTIRLTVVEANPVLGFWRRMGFAPTGESQPYERDAGVSRAIFLEKALGSASD